jgi:hypothetical protein
MGLMAEDDFIPSVYSCLLNGGGGVFLKHKYAVILFCTTLYLLSCRISSPANLWHLCSCGHSSFFCVPM